jgi:hypothetical protein
MHLQTISVYIDYSFSFEVLVTNVKENSSQARV